MCLEKVDFKTSGFHSGNTVGAEESISFATMHLKSFKNLYVFFFGLFLIQCISLGLWGIYDVL